jgi:AcrR family transcriptional regulator
MMKDGRMDATKKEPLKVGRKRDPSRDAAILEATLDILAEAGYAGLTVDMVAAAAGAGKATVYRRWPTKTDLVLDAISRVDAGQLDLEALPDTGTLRGDFQALLDSGGGDDGRRFRIMAGLTSMLADQPGLGEAADAALIGPWAAANLALIRRAVQRGEVTSDADVEALARVVPTMAAYRVCIQRLPIPNEFIASLIDGVLLPALGIAPAAAKPKPRRARAR